MAHKPLRAGDGEGFLRAFTDAWRDTEIEYDVVISMLVRRTSQKGVLALLLRADGIGEEDDHSAIWTYEVRYPSAQVGTFEAALYQAMVRLERLVADAQAHPSGV